MPDVFDPHRIRASLEEAKAMLARNSAVLADMAARYAADPWPYGDNTIADLRVIVGHNKAAVDALAIQAERA